MGTFYIILADYIKRPGSELISWPSSRTSKKGGAGTGLPGYLDRLASKIAFIYRRDFFATGASLFILLGKAELLMWILAILLPWKPGTSPLMRRGGSGKSGLRPDRRRRASLKIINKTRSNRPGKILPGRGVQNGRNERSSAP